MNAHFRLALKSDRERQFVQEVRTSALLWNEGPETVAELLRVTDEIRRSGLALDFERRQRIFHAVYSRLGRRDEATLLALLPPGDHLVTFRWLVAGRNENGNAELSYFHGRLTEAAGDCETAASLYRALLAQDTSFESRAKAGLARCEQRSTAASSR